MISTSLEIPRGLCGGGLVGQFKLEGVLYVEATQADCLVVVGDRSSGAITMLTATVVETPQGCL